MAESAASPAERSPQEVLCLVRDLCSREDQRAAFDDAIQALTEHPALVAETQRKDEALRKIEAICAAAPSGGTGLLNAMLHVLELSRAALKDPEGVQAARGAAESGSGEPRRANARSAPSGTAARGPEPEPRKLVNPLFPEFGDGLPVPDAGPEPETRCQECGHDPEDGHEFLCETGIAEIRARAARGPEPETKP